MSTICRTELTIDLPRNVLWALLTNVSARHLWEPSIESATLVDGFGGGNGSIVNLKATMGSRSIDVKERVTSSHTLHSLSIIQTWPKYRLQKKYMLSTRNPTTTALTLHTRYKTQSRILGLLSQPTQLQLEESSQKELSAFSDLCTNLSKIMTSTST